MTRQAAAYRVRKQKASQVKARKKAESESSKGTRFAGFNATTLIQKGSKQKVGANSAAHFKKTGLAFL